jgi:hypothetical protein
LRTGADAGHAPSAYRIAAACGHRMI